ncbi:MAG: hypothetical protein ACYDGY_06970 [Acidimicrobiales bacterium]
MPEPMIGHNAARTLTIAGRYEAAPKASTTQTVARVSGAFQEIHVVLPSKE